MIVTGIIKEINITNSASTHFKNLYMVDVGIFKTTANLNSKSSIVECTASVSGGIYQEYDVGDAVYVDFINDKANNPVIIGHIYQGLNSESSGARGFANFKALTVTDNVQLPFNTNIGNVDFQDLISKVYNNGKISSSQFSASDGQIKDIKINNVTIVDPVTREAIIPIASGYTYGVVQGDTITKITEVIPQLATAENKLTDKNFVNSSIATNTANFLGTLDVVTDLHLQYGASTDDVKSALNSYQFSKVKTNNDYCFVINKDIDDNTIYLRYKWAESESTFKYEYALNNSSFTAVLWASINSGITPSLVSDIGLNSASRHEHSNSTILNMITSNNQIRTITVSTEDPTGGSDGDIWLKYNV